MKLISLILLATGLLAQTPAPTPETPKAAAPEREPGPGDRREIDRGQPFGRDVTRPLGERQPQLQTAITRPVSRCRCQRTSSSV